MKVIHITLNFWVVYINNRFSHKITGNVLRLALSGVEPTPSPYKYNKTFHSTADFPQENLKPAIFLNRCVCPAYAGHTPKAFQIVQKYKFSFTNQVFGVLFFQRVQVPYERIETPNR